MNLRGLLKQPTLYASLYILQIFVFATAYDRMRGGFYAPYAKDETWSQQESENFKNAFNDRFKADIEDAIEKDEDAIFQNMAVKPVDLRKRSAGNWGISKISFDDGGNIRFSGEFETRYSYPVEVSASFYITGYYEENSNSTEAYGRGTYSHQSNDPIFRGTQDNKFRFVINIDRKMVNEIESLRDGAKGDPTTLTHSWFRMLYYSAIVNSTVGFGDIVPMNDLSRATTAIQAVLSIVWAGMFFNAAAQMPRQNSN